MKKKTVSAIDIGSSSVRMLVAELKDNSYEIIEDVRQPVKLGKDTFFRGKILRSTIDETIFILNKYKKLCEEYKVTEIKAVATTAVRESSNADIFIDNIKAYTGIDVEVIDATKETEYIHKALTGIIQAEENTNNFRCFVEVGSGTVEITIFDNDYILYSTSLPIGALKARQLFTKEYIQDSSNFANYLNIIVDHELRVLKNSIPMKNISKIYGIGMEIEQLSKVLGKNSNEQVSSIKMADLSKLCETIHSYSKEEIMHRIKVNYDLAENFHSSSNIFLSIIKFFQCDEIFIPQITLKECLILDMVNKDTPEAFSLKLEKQIMINSKNIGKSFNYDETHAMRVMYFAIKIFDATKNIHKLTSHEKCYLIAASILHDVGLSISNREHHKHSLYIIKTQNFYYFTDKERKIIANIARYHRRSPPKSTHSEYQAFKHEDKMIICKLASILRLAESLDSNHLQLVSDIDIEIKRNTMIVKARVKQNIYAETYSFDAKKDLFEDFFGFNVKLEVKILGNI